MFNHFSRYEDEFHQWVNDGYPGVKSETLDYLRHLSDPEDDTQPRAGTLWEHQWDSFLRVVYAHELQRNDLALPDGVLLNVVTGGGKTAIIAALIAWLRIAHDVQTFLLICPNLIVRDRLEDDFENGKVFTDRDLIPDGAIVTKDDFTLTTLGSDRPGGWSRLLGASIVLGNIHQFYTSNASGQSNLSALMNGPDFVLFNDEAHNSSAPEWEATLERMRPKTTLRVDTTATPDRADGQAPDSRMIYEYLIQDALSDRLVKTPVVYQPRIETVELTYTDARTGETRGVEEIDWAEVERLGLNATQWVTDDKPMQQQMGIALQRLREQERRAKGRYQPILFLVAVCKLDAQKAARTLNDYFKVKTLLITEDSTDQERRQATELGRARRSGQPYKAVVSVLMLREGWDVPEVGVVLLLRKFGSPVYGQQVIGRGLRRVRGQRVKEEEQQICAVVDHPKLEHQWLWEIFSSKVRTDVGVDDEFDEEEDLPEPPPRQEVVNPQNFIEVPEPTDDDPGEFDLGDIAAPPGAIGELAGRVEKADLCHADNNHHRSGHLRGGTAGADRRRVDGAGIRAGFAWWNLGCDGAGRVCGGDQSSALGNGGKPAIRCGTHRAVQGQNLRHIAGARKVELSGGDIFGAGRTSPPRDCLANARKGGAEHRRDARPGCRDGEICRSVNVASTKTRQKAPTATSVTKATWSAG